MDNVLQEAERLHKLGVAVLWLKPKSKAPVESRWTTGPKHDWTYLTKTYKPGYNVGVRLGAPSRLSTGKYLAVIDVDIKSTEEKHRGEALEAVKGLFPELHEDWSVQVLSGRGNGSRHFYIVTTAPAVPSKRRMSTDRVKVLMPSAPIPGTKPENLTEAEVKAGWRIRPAWEVAVMGEGQQVVLPPSTHPDSGRAYRWKIRLEEAEDLVEIETGHKENSNTKIDRTATQDWTPENVELAFCDHLSKETVDLILEADCDDRSAALFDVAKDMISAGLTDRQIMSVLTDQSYGLGGVAYEHAKTKSRLRAANWIFNYTLKKARKDLAAQLEFDENVETPVLLSDEEVEQQDRELKIDPSDWRARLDATQKGKYTATLNNALLILQNTLGKNVFKRDVFALKDKNGLNTPWGGKIDEDIRDADILKMKVWFIDAHRIEFDKTTLEDAVGYIGLVNAYHPVRDYLDALEWDGTPRLDKWLRTYLGADMPEPYLSAVSRKTLCAMVARIYQPGVKFDHVLIMNGEQGVGKSSAARILASPQWFMDRLPDLRDKDAMINLQGIWVVEMGELANMRLSSVETYKAFLSSQVDKFRLPYGRRREDFERQCVIVGSSNPVEFLNDNTGNRRFWPVKVKQCRFKALAQDRDQLLAEAKFMWVDLNEPLYLNPTEEKQAVEVQNSHRHEDIDLNIEEMWFDYMEKEATTGGVAKMDKFKLDTLFGPGEVFEKLTFTKDIKKVAQLLKRVGYLKEAVDHGRKWWFKKGGEEHQKLLKKRGSNGVPNEH